MSVDSMAPEAFTNSELAQAMTWREKQPEYIQKMTSTPDSLMSFYKRFLRSKKAPHHAARDGQNFQADLKSLAEGLKNFDNNENSKDVPFQPTLGHEINFNETPEPSSPDHLKPNQPTTADQPNSPTAKRPELSGTATTENQAVKTQMARSSIMMPNAPPRHGVDAENQLDSDSQKMIQEVKLRMNLSSDQEALRVLIKIGYDKLIRSL